LEASQLAGADPEKEKAQGAVAHEKESRAPGTQGGGCCHTMEGVAHDKGGHHRARWKRHHVSPGRLACKEGRCRCAQEGRAPSRPRMRRCRTLNESMAPHAQGRRAPSRRRHRCARREQDARRDRKRKRQSRIPLW
jgi:hypothetical protein